MSTKGIIAVKKTTNSLERFSIIGNNYSVDYRGKRWGWGRRKFLIAQHVAAHSNGVFFGFVYANVFAITRVVNGDLSRWANDAF